ncbi:uncharacterized protein KIAA1143 homolog [Ctenocephalides felis]|uniref:uncharacterized protein KIAA1143 homolog n=1 Tax=Ctenocephalides felis TaxID=7515 RepID=UPI000E6E2CFF|nr:uncharacterized protein KIAA1143 homolog [Ctenocephalides felis]
MSKKNSITYIKPEEPSFLKKLKAQIGYKEGPTVETKREALEYDDSEQDPDFDEAPQVVVLKQGDLTAEQAAIEKERLQKEEENKPADLSQRVIFQSSKKPDLEKPEEKGKKRVGPEEKSKSDKKKRKSDKRTVPVLSFDVDEN